MVIVTYGVLERLHKSIIISPTITTTYSVIVSQNGCDSFDDIIVTVNTFPGADAGNDVSICLGESTTLTASGGDSYIWSTGETTQSISVGPNESTYYFVTVSQNGCQATDDVLVSVDTLSNADAGLDETICEGETITLTASGGDNYEWNNGQNNSKYRRQPTINNNIFSNNIVIQWLSGRGFRYNYC